MSILDILNGNPKPNPLGAPSQGLWNLSRGVYTDNVTQNSVVFFYEQKTSDSPKTQSTAIDQISDSGGRRLAVYEYPYKDGQAVDDLGRKGETLTFNIKFYGLNYQTKFQQFINVVVNSKNQGTIIHPVRGAITVRFREYEFMHRNEEWNAVTIKAIFVEDNSNSLQTNQQNSATPDSAIRSSLQTLSNLQSQISSAISSVTAALSKPGSIQSSLQSTLITLTAQGSRLIAQLGASFSTDTSLNLILSQASNLPGGSPALNSGTVATQVSGSTVLSQLPPVFQVGFDPATQALITSNLNSFINANQVNAQQAIFAANQMRAGISQAIADINSNLGNSGYSIVINYRTLANSIQQAVESAISSAQKNVIIYTVPYTMSLRMVAKLNNLSPDNQNDIVNLNPYLSSINLVKSGTQLTVPVS
jgi:hypothetical protein